MRVTAGEGQTLIIDILSFLDLNSLRVLSRNGPRAGLAWTSVANLKMLSQYSATGLAPAAGPLRDRSARHFRQQMQMMLMNK